MAERVSYEQVIDKCRAVMTRGGGGARKGEINELARAVMEALEREDFAGAMVAFGALQYELGKAELAKMYQSGRKSKFTAEQIRAVAEMLESGYTGAYDGLCEQEKRQIAYRLVSKRFPGLPCRGTVRKWWVLHYPGRATGKASNRAK